MAGSDPLFTSSAFTHSAAYNNSSVPLSNGAWGEIEEDPEMRCDDDFLSFLNSHQHHTSIGPMAPSLNCLSTDTLVGMVAPATGEVTKRAYGPLSVTEDYFLPTRQTPSEEVEEMLCGWECPRCKLCLSPHVDACERCAPAWP